MTKLIIAAMISLAASTAMAQEPVKQQRHRNHQDYTGSSEHDRGDVLRMLRVPYHRPHHRHDRDHDRDHEDD